MLCDKEVGRTNAGVICAILLVFATVFSSKESLSKESLLARQLTVHLQEVFDAKVSLIPFNRSKALYSNPIGEVSGVKPNRIAVIKIPVQYLPGEFVLRIDYRAKKTDSPYPAERIIFINEQDIELTVNPAYINNDEKTKFNAGETENTVYSAFMKENNVKRAPVDLLRQFLLSYDRPESEFYAQAVNEFQQRRIEYNAWLAEQAKKYRKLYASRLFQFQYIPEIAWGGSEKERMEQILKNYFEGIDFSDPLIIRSRELFKFMDVYMGLYGMQVKTEKERDALFTQAGSIACEKASKGDPQVYGWMVDYFYSGYETYNIKKGMEMLQQHINNPNCLTSKKLAPGVLSPDLVSSDNEGNNNEGNNFDFHKWINRIRQWFNEFY